MTLDEMKLAVCEKLPELIVIDSSYSFIDCDPRPRWRYNSEHHYYRRDLAICWPTEGLQVCHEAERALSDFQKQKFGELLQEMSHEAVVGYVPDYLTSYDAIGFQQGTNSIPIGTNWVLLSKEVK